MKFTVFAPLMMLLVAIIIGGFPMFFVFLSSVIAELNGCVVNEGDVNPCMLLGVDIGELLYNMFAMGWLIIVTQPFGLFVGGISLILLVIGIFVKNKVSD